MHRTFKTMAAASRFVEEHPGTPWHMSVNHDPKGTCTPQRCVCRPTFVVTAWSPEFQATLDARERASRPVAPAP